jgi:GNAT superfamily N-acetyltransferase
MVEQTLEIVPANEASADDLDLVFGQRGDPSGCQCQWFKLDRAGFRSTPRDGKRELLREQTQCGSPRATATSGLVAYLDGEPVGWVAVEPRTAYPRLLGMRVPWAGRDEDRADDGVWAVTCFVTRTGYRHRGVARALAQASVDFARSRGARVLEGYPIATEPGAELTWGELYVGSVGIFEGAGFAEVSAPTPRRRVMRVEL